MKDPRRSSANARGQGSYVSNACSVCRHKKIKCDGGKPQCQSCTNNGRESECTYSNVASRRPRTEAHFQALYQKDESRKQHIRRLEALLDQCQKEHPGSTAGSYLQFRPADWDESPVSYSPDEAWNEVPEDEEQDGGGVVDELCLPVRSLSLAEDGGLLLHGAAAPLRYVVPERPQSAIGRLLAISENPDEYYTLQIDGVDMVNFNPNFDWSRHLPPEVNLTRSQHDKILYDVFRFITGWCLRIVPPLFLRDMCRALNAPKNQTPPRQSHYSPMLHNAILAVGTAFSDVSAIRDLKARKYFLDKAKDYIEEEFSRPHLCVVQALSLIASFHSSQGDRTLGYMYFGMSGRASQALGLSVDCSSWVESGYITAEDQVDRNWVYWSTFCQDVHWSLGVGRDFCIPGEPKNIVIPFTDADFDNEDWVYHSIGKQPQTGYEVTTFREICGLMTIAKRIMDVVNTLDRLKNPQWVVEIININVALHQWNNDLPEELKNTVKRRSNPTPNFLQLHFTFHWCFLLLHRPFCRRRSRAVLVQENVFDHLKICKQAADATMDLMSTWREHFTLRYAPTRLIRPVFAAATIFLFLALQAVKGMRPAKKELRHAVENTNLCIKYLKEIGETWPCATKMANILKEMFHTRVSPEIGGLISPASSGILPPREHGPEHARTDGAGDGKRKKPNSIPGRRQGPSIVDDNAQDSNNSNSQQRIVNGVLSTSMPSSQIAVHTPVQNLPPALMPQIPTPPSPQFATPRSFRDRTPLPSALPPYLSMQPTQPIHAPSPIPSLWTGLSVGGDGSHAMPSVERPAGPTLTSYQQSHARHPFSVNGMNTSQHTFGGDQTWTPSTLFGTAPLTSAVHTNGNTAGGGAKPIGSGSMSYLFAMPDGRGLGETELGEDPMTALNQFELLQPGEEASADLLDMEWGEQELCEDLDVAEYTYLFGE